MADETGNALTRAGELTATATLEASMDFKREQHARRAARFGMGTVAPVRDFSVLGANRAAARRGGGFVTGFDMSAPEQAEKRASRAARFATLDAVATATASAVDGLGGEGQTATGLAATAPLGLGLNGVQECLGELRPVVVAEVDPLENRRDVAIGEVLRPNVLHVFGVDDMSTDDIRRHFLEYGPSWIEWINDSSCNVTFEDAHTATRVLTFMVPPADGLAVGLAPDAAPDAAIPDAPPDRMSDADGSGANAPVAAEGAAELDAELTWRKLAPFVMRDRARSRLLPLWMRRATERDVRPERPNPRSKWARSVVGGLSERGAAREKGRKRSVAAVDGSVDKDKDIAMAVARRRGGRKRRGGDDETMRPGIARRLGVRGGIAKAKAKKPSLMDVDRALDSTR